MNLFKIAHDLYMKHLHHSISLILALLSLEAKPLALDDLATTLAMLQIIQFLGFFIFGTLWFSTISLPSVFLRAIILAKIS